MPRGGFSTFLRVFLFLWEVSRVSARSLQCGDDEKKQIAKRQVRYENKRKKRDEGVKKVNAKEKEKVKDSERESMKKRRTKSDAPLKTRIFKRGNERIFAKMTAEQIVFHGKRAFRTIF